MFTYPKNRSSIYIKLSWGRFVHHLSAVWQTGSIGCRLHTANTMSKRVLNNWAFLHILTESTSNKQKRALLNTATTEQVKAVAEIVANTLAGSLPVPPSARKRLLRYRTGLREIAAQSTSISKRKALLLKFIRALGTLLSSIKPALKLLKPCGV